MQDVQTLMEEVYEAFNRRDADAVLACMTEDVDWPKASEGGRARGREEVRAYWERQWAEFDPRVEPMVVAEGVDGRVEVRVHQVVRDLAGTVLMDGEVRHLYTLRDGRVARMELGEVPPAWTTDRS